MTGTSKLTSQALSFLRGVVRFQLDLVLIILIEAMDQSYGFPLGETSGDHTGRTEHRGFEQDRPVATSSDATQGRATTSLIDGTIVRQLEAQREDSLLVSAATQRVISPNGNSIGPLGL